MNSECSSGVGTFHGVPLLQKPVVVPQVRRGLGMPHVRCYSEALAPFGISQEQFLRFLDELNTVTASSPIFTYVDDAGEILGNIPDIMTAGVQTGVAFGIQAGAEIGQGLVSYVRGENFIKRKNEELFRPRNLQVSLLSAKKLRAALGLPPDASLSLPLAFTEHHTSNQSLMAGLEGLVTPLSFDVPPPAPVIGKVDRMNAKVQERAFEKQSKKAVKNREKYQKETERFQASMERKNIQRDGSIAALEAKREEKKSKRALRLAEATRKEGKERARKMKEAEEQFEDEMKDINRKMRDVEKEYQQSMRDKHSRLDELDEEAARNAAKTYWVVVRSL